MLLLVMTESMREEVGADVTAASVVGEISQSSVKQGFWILPMNISISS